MAGHSKWANIKHRKAGQDAKRGKIFTKLIRELVVAAKEGGGNPADNPRLRAAIDKSLGANMKRDTIDKAILRGAGGAEGELQKLLKQKFKKVANVKPPASRSDSSEKFVVATGFRGATDD